MRIEIIVTNATMEFNPSGDFQKVQLSTELFNKELKPNVPQFQSPSELRQMAAACNAYADLMERSRK